MNIHTPISHLADTNMTSKGQVLIPKAIRDRTGLVPGCPVRVGINDRGEAVVLPAQSVETLEARGVRIRAAIASVVGTVSTGFATPDAYMDFIRPHRRDPE